MELPTAMDAGVAPHTSAWLLVVPCFATSISFAHSPPPLPTTAPAVQPPSEAELRSLSHEQLVQLILRGRSPSAGPAATPGADASKKRERAPEEEEADAVEHAATTGDASASAGEKEEGLEPPAKKVKTKKVRSESDACAECLRGSPSTFISCCVCVCVCTGV
jgi:hypothetical protein